MAPATHEVLEQRLNDPQIVQAKLDDPVKHVNEGMIAGLVLGAPNFSGDNANRRRMQLAGA